MSMWRTRWRAQGRGSTDQTSQSGMKPKWQCLQWSARKWRSWRTLRSWSWTDMRVSRCSLHVYEHLFHSPTHPKRLIHHLVCLDRLSWALLFDFQLSQHLWWLKLCFLLYFGSLECQIDHHQCLLLTFSPHFADQTLGMPHLFNGCLEYQVASQARQDSHFRPLELHQTDFYLDFPLFPYSSF